ncbi:hypothetical protein [Thauera sp.]|jgi:hypothetical protein|uniref:hypothetical protein n=1 Tax=Thauera sp. TaxID=1905334 RepID=UPI001DFDA2B2|nr:hypothetical protein [Thauera sp.]MBV2204614.1 hypothetical protein [Pseudomonas sp.]HRO34849.1 hypothetical protein [Thauera sp.]
MAAAPPQAEKPPRRSLSTVLHRCGACLSFAWKLALGAGMLTIWLLVGGVIVLLALNLHAPPSWYFSISAQTEAADIELAAGRETQWRIEGAVVCATTVLPAPLELLPRAASSPCGGRRWQAHALPGGEDAEHVLMLGGASASAADAAPAALQVGLSRSDGGLQMSIRGPGPLRLATSGQEIALPPGLNLIWAGEARPRDLVFPFTAERVRVGRDVTWSDASMLRDGTLVVFTASEESLAKRSQVEEVALMPGDQVRLERHDGGGVFHPKGFLRFDRVGAGDAPASLGIVAFGRAESIRIERFGDSGYEFKPGWWVGILHDRRLMMASASLIALITVLGGIAGCRELAPSPAKAWRALRRAWRPAPLPTQDDER